MTILPPYLYIGSQSGCMSGSWMWSRSGFGSWSGSWSISRSVSGRLI